MFLLASALPCPVFTLMLSSAWPHAQRANIYKYRNTYREIQAQASTLLYTETANIKIRKWKWNENCVIWKFLCNSCNDDDADDDDDDDDDQRLWWKDQHADIEGSPTRPDGSQSWTNRTDPLPIVIFDWNQDFLWNQKFVLILLDEIAQTLTQASKLENDQSKITLWTFFKVFHCFCVDPGCSSGFTFPRCLNHLRDSGENTVV